MRNYRPLLAGVLLGLSACSAGTQTALGPQPLPSPWHTEFRTRDGDGDSRFGPFLAATLASQGVSLTDAARFYLAAHVQDPSSRFVADRAFFQLLLAGHVDDASQVADDLMQGEITESDDLVDLVRVLDAYRDGNWPLVRERAVNDAQSGFASLFMPVLTAWSHAAEKNEAAARDALGPLLRHPRLKAIGDEQLAYMLDYMGSDEAGVLYRTLVDSGDMASLQPIVAYAYHLRRKASLDKARSMLDAQVQRYDNNAFLLREGARIIRGSGPSRHAATPLGAASLVFYRLGSEFAQGPSTQAALIYLQLASYLDPAAADVHLLIGSLYEKMESFDNASVAYEAVPRSNPLWRTARTRRVEALRAGGRDNEAIGLIHEALRDEPQNRTLLAVLGDIQRSASAFEEAAVYYTRAIETLPQPQERDWFLFFARGVCYERMDDWPRAETDLITALRLNPDEPSVLNYLGYSWIDRGERIAEAKTMILRAVEARPDDGFIVDSLGWVYYLTGEYGQAVDALERAVRLEPEDPTINHHLGDAYWRVGRRFEARFQWRHALIRVTNPEERSEILMKLDRGLPETTIASGADPS